ncbi:protein SPIRRIG-like [Silene latifolia]|uniref:protein SPIRRIG-like n=1 Tax=Silene latifolia TaxID=37657 RepID=UPI003D78762A
MFGGKNKSGTTMKWTSLLKDLREKVGLNQQQQQQNQQNFPSVSSSNSLESLSDLSSASELRNNHNAAPHSPLHYTTARDKHELELDFRRFWEEFRSSSSEKEKEMALNMAVDAFCKLAKHHADVAQLVETHIFSFVVGRAFVTDIEKLKISNKTRRLDVEGVLRFFSEASKDGICPGANLLSAIEVLVSGPIDKQSLLDSGILCCLIYILNALLGSTGGTLDNKNDKTPANKHEADASGSRARQLEVEGSVVHIMKALASHSCAAQSLIEDDSLQLLFQMVVNGSLTVFLQYRAGLVPLHSIQLHRHAMQVLGLLLVNDNGSTAKYIRKHHLIKSLLMTVKDFNPDCGDPAYTIGVVDLLLECIELSHRPEAGGVKLREDIHNAHGYHFLVQFALTLASMPQNQSEHLRRSSSSQRDSAGVGSLEPVKLGKQEVTDSGNGRITNLPPALSRLLDVLVALAQTGPMEPPPSRSSRTSHAKSGDHGRSRTASSDTLTDIWETGNAKVKDLEAVQMLQDIFLKADSTALQAEVLNRMFKIFSSHIENYQLCQQLRTVPLFILNMAGFPPTLQEIILKILEYAVTVVNCIPEQELLSLCCLLQQPITSDLKHTILSFFVKLLSFDQQYKKVLREVGVLAVLLDDLKHHTVQSGPQQLNGESNHAEQKSSPSGFQKHLDNKDAIITSPKLMDSGSGRFPLFEAEGTISIAWDCMVSLLKKAEANQSSFRSVNGVAVVLPLLVSDVHRAGVLRTLSCLIIEDVNQVHAEEMGGLLEIMKSGMITSVSGSQYKLRDDAKCDMFGALWRILGVNNSAQKVFGEATGFSLLLTALHDFQSEGEQRDQSQLVVYVKVLTYLLRVVTVAVCENPINRAKLHTIITSHTFYDLLCESGLLCVDFERQVVHLLLELALEMVIPPFLASESAIQCDKTESPCFLLSTPSGVVNPETERVYNAGAVRVIIRSLLLFTPKVQLEVLQLIEKLARAGSFNQENLTSVGCVELLLEMIQPFLQGSSPLLLHALKIVEVLGAYRLSTLELRLLVRYVVQLRKKTSGDSLICMMERLIQMEDMALQSVSLAPFVEMDMSKVGHACIQVSLGERSWPPVAGYSFVCWFQYRNFLKTHVKDSDQLKLGSRKPSSIGQQKQILRLFSVGSVDSGNTFYAELYLQEDGLLTLATSNSASLSFSGLDLEEGRWHHLAVVHSKPNALAGLFQASIAYVYVNGKLRHTGKLGYSPSPIGKRLQITIGTPATHARVGDLQWKLRSCYLFEEVLSSGSICFMYILGRGYRGLYQDTDLLRFVPNQACGGDCMAILDSLETDQSTVAGTQKPDSSGKLGISRADGSGIVWDLERLGNLSLQLSGKKLIFAFDGTSTESLRASGSLSLLNLVDPTSAAASPIGGIPRFGRLHGDVYVCKPCVIGDIIHPLGGMISVLSLVEAAETRDMLHMALTLLACSLHQNPQNIREMQSCRGYHLLSLFLYRRMSLFDMHCLEIFFKIAACEASFSEPKKLESSHVSLSPLNSVPEATFEELNLSKFREEFSSVGSQGDMDDFSAQKDAFSHISELEAGDLPSENTNCIVLSNADMVEHVLLDWTLWVTAQVPIQIALLNFLEHLVSIHWYRYHNLTVLRRINLVQHLLVTLQRGDVEVPVLEKLVVLLGVILEDGFLTSELESVVKFVIMTFDPPELTKRQLVARESMGKHVIVRNMLLEMLIDLQVTISSEELLEQWHRIVSSRIVTYLLDEAVHPSSMRWIMTLLGVCLTSSPTFALKFRIRGFQGLMRVLPSFYDSPDIYYILFCLMFGKPVYPRLPEVRLLDFHALVPSDGDYNELKFVELLESIIAMAKSTFDRLSMQCMLAHQTGNLSQVGAGLVAEFVEENTDMIGELQGEALMHKTYAARLMGGEASAPAAATSVLRFMVDLAKMCPPFSSVCRRSEILESCVDLYFSCVRASYAVKLAKELSVKSKTEDKSFVDFEDANSSQNTFSSLPQDPSGKTSISASSFPRGQASNSSEDVPMPMNDTILPRDISVSVKTEDGNIVAQDGRTTVENLEDVALDKIVTSSSNMIDTNLQNVRGETRTSIPTDSRSSTSFAINSPILSERSNSKLGAASTSSVYGPTSGLNITATASLESSNTTESDTLADKKFTYQGQSAENTLVINSKLLLEIDDSGYGGGPCAAGATAVLDFLAEVLSDVMTEQIKAVPVVERILDSVPLYVETEAALVFQGLCFSRVMNFLERRLLRDDEENAKKLDKNRWSSNLDVLCSVIVDRVYMGAFPRPGGVLRTLEFLLSMLQLANKDGRIEDASPALKGLLSIGRGNRQLDPYIGAILKNTNRMVLYCFLPSFLETIGEDDLLSSLGMTSKTRKGQISDQEETGIDICTVLQLLDAHIRLILCPSNVDAELNSCLCVNLISLLRDERQNSRNMAIDILKYLLVHRRAAFEDLLVSKANRMDVLHGGFDKLLTGSLPSFLEWFKNSEQIVNKILENTAGLMWVQSITAASKFPEIRLKSMENHRGTEMIKKSKELAKLEAKHREQITERRYALDLLRDAVSTELRVVRQDKYGWVLHAESEWQCHLQQLVHERALFPIQKTPETGEPEWQLCPIEGPYRMRKKLQRCKLKADSIQNVLDWQFDFEQTEFTKEKNENGLNASDSGSGYFSQLFVDGPQQLSLDGELYDEFSVKELYDVRETSSARNTLIDDRASSMNEASLHSAVEFGGRSSALSATISESIPERSELESPAQSSSMRTDDVRVSEDKSERELLDNGEYLIRPYLEPLEKIRFRYNCERVVGLDKHDGIFLIGELCLYVIENFYIDNSGCICEKESEDELSVIDQELGVKKDVMFTDFPSKSTSSWAATVKTCTGGRAWAYNGGAWGKEKACANGTLPHPWRMWKLNSVHEILKRDYQLRPVAIEIFSMDGCNDLLVFHKKEREDVFKNLVAMNLPRNSMLDTTISGITKQDSNEGSRLFKLMAKSFSKRWQNGEISNFQYLMHLNTLAGRGYSDLTQYPVFPWVLADYESEELDLNDPNSFRKLDKPMGCQTPDGEEEFRKRYESWDDPEVPKFHYGSHYSSAGIVLFYLLRLPPFSTENQKLQGGQFDHADRLFNSIRDTWASAAGKGNTSDVKELIPEFFYMPDFLENRFNLDLGEKQSGEKVENVVLPPWAKGSVREFIRKHREALECDYVSENLHHWIDLIFGYKQRGKAAEDAVNVFYHYTYEGNVDIDSVTDPAMKASILAQINHFGQTPKQLFQKSHVKRKVDRKPPHPLKYSTNLVPHDVRKTSSSITQIVTVNDKILLAGGNTVLKPRTYAKYLAWGFPDRSLRFMSYDQDRLLTTHENLHGGNQIQCVGVSHDGQIVVTGGDEGLVSVWRIHKDGPRSIRRLQLEKALCAHTSKVSCLYVSQPYMLFVTGSDDCTVILWDLSSLAFVRQLPEFPAPISAIYVNDLTGEILTAAGVLLAIWSINGDCLAVVNTSQLPSDSILSVTSCTSSDWQDTNWYVTGHQSGAVKVWKMVHCSNPESAQTKPTPNTTAGMLIGEKSPEYRLLLHKVLKSHKHPVTALHLTTDLKQMLSGDSGGYLLSWTLPGESLRGSSGQG